MRVAFAAVGAGIQVDGHATPPLGAKGMPVRQFVAQVVAIAVAVGGVKGAVDEGIGRGSVGAIEYAAAFVLLKTEVGRYDERVVAVNFILHAHVDAVVGIGGTAAVGFVVKLAGIAGKKLLPAGLATGCGGAVVEEIAAAKIYFFVGPKVAKINTHGIGFGNAGLLPYLKITAATLTAGPATPATSAGAAPATATAAPLVGGAAYAKQVFAAKVLLVYVVEQSHQVYPFVALKNVDAAAGGIAFVGAIAGVHPAKLTVAHVGLGYNV